MYTDEDLNSAVKAEIFSEDAVNNFRQSISDNRASPLVDEENFRLISSFNDIFVVIACILVLVSSVTLSYSYNHALSMLVLSAVSWGLAEFFVRKRNMSLPAIVLLCTYVGGFFALPLVISDAPKEQVFVMSAALSAMATWLHWKRFQVPITVSAGMATLVVLMVSILLSQFPSIKDFMLVIIFVSGIVTFYVAMRWDLQDVKRITRKSDVAFWLHLMAAPLIVHPIFTSLGILDNEEKSFSILIIVVLYILMTVISLLIDRRAFMVSSLIYVLFAISTLLKNYGIENNGFALSGVLIGMSLLMLSGYWHSARKKLKVLIPPFITKLIP